jgi:hypothetical protein
MSSLNRARVSHLTTEQALHIYRTMGPDLRRMFPLNWYNKSMKVGWAFQPENASLLLEVVKRFMHGIGVTHVYFVENNIMMWDHVTPRKRDHLGRFYI